MPFEITTVWMVGPQQQLLYSVSLLHLGCTISWCNQAMLMLQESIC